MAPQKGQVRKTDRTDSEKSESDLFYNALNKDSWRENMTPINPFQLSVVLFLVVGAVSLCLLLAVWILKLLQG